MNRALLTVLCLCLISLSLGCVSSGVKYHYGSLTITIDNPLLSSIDNEPDMETVYYTITGSGPGGSDCYRKTTAQYCEIYDLLEGDWSFTVDGFNANRTKLVTGTKNVFVRRNTTTSVTIPVAQLTGEGTLSLYVSWPVGTVEDPSINAALEFSDETVMDISDRFEIFSSSASLSINLEAGFYTVNIELKDGPARVWGDIAVIKTAYSQTTNLRYTLGKNELVYGTLIITEIIYDYQNPIDFRLVCQKTSLTGMYVLTGMYEDLRIEAATREEVDSYQWFLNGKLLEGENNRELTIGSNLPPGYYRVYCIVKKGEILSGSGIEFSKFPEIKKVEEIATIRLDDMVWDGENYWGLYLDAIYKLDRQMSVIEEYSLPIGIGRGIAWDGTHFWIVSTTKLYKLNTGFELAGEFELPFSYAKDAAWDGNNLWVADSDGYLIKYDVYEDRLEAIGTYTLGCESVAGIIWVNEKLWVVDRSNYPAIHVFSNSLQILNRYYLYHSIPTKKYQNSVTGLCWDGKNFWTFSNWYWWDGYYAYKIYGLEVD